MFRSCANTKRTQITTHTHTHTHKTNLCFFNHVCDFCCCSPILGKRSRGKQQRIVLQEIGAAADCLHTPESTTNTMPRSMALATPQTENRRQTMSCILLDYLYYVPILITNRDTATALLSVHDDAIPGQFQFPQASTSQNIPSAATHILATAADIPSPSPSSLALLLYRCLHSPCGGGRFARVVVAAFREDIEPSSSLS